MFWGIADLNYSAHDPRWAGMVVFQHLMRGSLLLPQRRSQQSQAIVQSAKIFTPEAAGTFRVRPLRICCSCKLVGAFDRQEFPSKSVGLTGRADSAYEFCFSNRVRARRVSSAEDTGTRRMKCNSLASFPCPYSSPLAPSAFRPSVAIQGQTLDYCSWKRLISVLPGPFRHPALSWYCDSSRALRGLKTTHYGSIAGKKAGHDLLVRDSNKCSWNKLDFYVNRCENRSISARSSSEGGCGDVNAKDERDAYEAVTISHEGFDSDSEDDAEDVQKKDKKEKRLKGMMGEEVESESDSDDEEEEYKTKSCMSNGEVEVVGMSGYESDSDSDSEEKEIMKKLKAEEKERKKQVKKEVKDMKKKMKAEAKELKKQAKKEEKEIKASEKMECEDSDSEDEDKKMKRKLKVATMELAVPCDENVNQQYDSSEAPEPDGDSELEGQEDEDFSDEIKNEIEDAFDEDEDEELDDEFWEEEEGEAEVGDGGDGGGVVLGDTLWGNKALELAQVVVKELGHDFTIYAFKVSPDGLLRVRLDKLSDKYGSPTMTEIEAFSRKYIAILDDSEVIPDNVSVEVSSPGAERVVKVPDELERFKLLPMYVQYLKDGSDIVEELLEFDSLDSASGMTVWKLANVKFNRELSGKGRPLNSKQRKWRAHVPVSSLKLVRLYLDV